jgi:hypothetical protein
VSHRPFLAIDRLPQKAGQVEPLAKHELDYMHGMKTGPDSIALQDESALVMDALRKLIV